MPQLRPSWQLSVMVALCLAVLALACLPVRHRWARAIGAFAREFTLVMSLLAIWQWVGGYVHTRVAGAMDRGVEIYQWQRTLRLPSEATLQQAVLHLPWLVRAADTYYGYAHLNGMAVFLVWIWWRHRAAYPQARYTVVLVTLSCLLIQIVPVAPPRLLPQFGFVDTALLYGQSVYGAFGTGMANQLSAMPSVHVGWAVIVGWFVWRHGSGAWRWIGPAHTVLTTTVVVVTANHWWLDGIVAAALVVLALRIATVLDRLMARIRMPRWLAPARTPEPAPAVELAQRSGR